MNTTLTPYYFNSKPVRSLTDESGNPWFVAKDVCDALGLDNRSMALKKIPDNHKGVNSIDTPGGIQQVNMVSEPGLYRLVLRSDKPEAEPFMEWITSDVLPSIRKTGAYAIGAPSGPEPEHLSEPLSERSRIAAIFYRNMNRLQTDMIEISDGLTDNPSTPISLVMVCTNALTQAGVCRRIAKLFFEETK